MRKLAVSDLVMLESGELVFATIGGIIGGLTPDASKTVRVLSLAHCDGSVHAVAPHPTDPALVYTVGDDRCLSVWNTVERYVQQKRSLTNSNGSVVTFAASKLSNICSENMKPPFFQHPHC